MYYQGHAEGPPFKEFTLYARSQDGIHWEKPNLGLAPIEGSRENNQIGTTDGKRLYPDGEPGVEVFIDRRPGVPKGERFKAFTLDESEKPIVRVHAWVSGNATHFRPLQEAPIISTDIPNVFDGQETLFWSEAEQMYLIYTRYSASKDRKTLKRSVARLTSKDFLKLDRTRSHDLWRYRCHSGRPALQQPDVSLFSGSAHLFGPVGSIHGGAPGPVR